MAKLKIGNESCSTVRCASMALRSNSDDNKCEIEPGL